MLIDFFFTLKEFSVPVSIKEYLVMIEALKQHVAYCSVDEFYYLGRTCLVKDEKHFDKYDRAFGKYFKGVLSIDGVVPQIPEEWLRRMAEKYLTEEEKQLIESMGGWDKLMDPLAHPIIRTQI